MLLKWFLVETKLIQCCLKIPYCNVLATLVENDQIWNPSVDCQANLEIIREHNRVVVGGAERLGCVSSNYQKILKAWEYINKRLVQTLIIR